MIQLVHWEWNVFFWNLILKLKKKSAWSKWCVLITQRQIKGRASSLILVNKIDADGRKCGTEIHVQNIWFCPVTKKQSLVSYTYFEKDLTGWNLLSTETIVAQENCGNNWIIYVRTVVQFETVPSTESMLLEDFLMSIPIFKGNNIITKLKSVNVTEIWSLVTIQEH